MVKAWHLTFIVMQDREATRRGSRTGLILQNEIGRTKIALGTDFIPGTIEKVRILPELARNLSLRLFRRDLPRVNPFRY